MKVKINQKVKQIISSLGNKTAQSNGLKIWASLYKMSSKSNKHGYFDCPSSYLESVNKRYKRTIDAFIKEGILTYYKRVKEDKNDIFNSIETKYYNVSKGLCMKYKFLIDLSKDYEWIEVDMNSNKKYRWYSILENSLLELGYEVKITRDNFGLRVHHPVIPVYKTDLKDRGFAIIDAVASQPKLLYLLMKDKGIIDVEYNKAFEGDFYNYVVKKLNLDNRKMAKDLFMYWLNSSGYVPNYKIHILFPIASKFIKTLKSKNYKDSSSYLQRIESNIWIDNLLHNIPCDFALPIHDCLIVKDKDAVDVLEYCKSSYSNIDFKVEYL